MEEEFNKVKCLGCCGTLVNFLLMLGFMKVNTFQDAQLPEIKQAQLQLLPGFVLGDTIGGRASFIHLFQTSHSSMLRKPQGKAKLLPLTRDTLIFMNQ